MNEKMKAALKKECSELGLTVSESAFSKMFVNWTLDYLREQQEPVATVRAHRTGGIAWSAVPAENTLLMRDGTPLYAHPVPENLACPFPCGWRELHKITNRKAAYFARALDPDEPLPEEARAAAIQLNNYLLEILRVILQSQSKQEDSQ